MASPPVTPSPFIRRPISYSESHIHLPRIQSNLRPLLTSPASAADITIREPPQSSDTPVPHFSAPLHIEYITSGGSTLTESVDRRWIIPITNWTLRFNLHLALISLFETLFFWHFVSPSEDTALTSLVRDYTATTLQACAALTTQQRASVRAMFDQIIDVDAVDIAGAVAATTRASFNDTLLRSSWLYCGGLNGLFVILTMTAWRMGIPVSWRHLVAENVALIALLACYEAMFFSTIAFRYQAVSMAELDRMVADQIQSRC